MGLFILPGLQAVFRHAQETIGPGQLIHCLPVHQSLVPQQGKHRHDGPDLQVRVPPAMNQLKGLADELDFPDAPLAQLDVGIHAPPVHLRLDAALHVADGVDGAEIDIAPIDEGTQDAQQLFPVGIFPGDGPGLDHGIAFPLPGLGRVIGLHGAETQGQGAGFAEGAQAHVHPEYETILRHLAQRVYELAPQSGEELFIAQGAAAISLAMGGKGEDEIDIGRQVKFPGAQFAHAQYHQALGVAVHVPWHTGPGNRPVHEPRQGLAYALVRQLGEVFQGFFQRSLAADVPPDDAQHLPPAETAQGGQQRLFVSHSGQHIRQLPAHLPRRQFPVQLATAGQVQEKIRVPQA